MSQPAAYYVYILASSRHGTLYIGVCNDMSNRLALHRAGRGSQFVKTYNVARLVYVETHATPREAIQREKQLKEWHRDWKIRLIEENNPEWSDLSHLLWKVVVMGPGLRRDDVLVGSPPHIADNSLSPQ